MASAVKATTSTNLIPNIHAQIEILRRGTTSVRQVQTTITAVPLFPTQNPSVMRYDRGESVSINSKPPFEQDNYFKLLADSAKKTYDFLQNTQAPCAGVDVVVQITHGKFVKILDDGHPLWTDDTRTLTMKTEINPLTLENWNKAIFGKGPFAHLAKSDESKSK